MKYEDFEKFLKSGALKLSELADTNDLSEYMPSFALGEDLQEFFFKNNLPMDAYYRIQALTKRADYEQRIANDWDNVRKNTNLRALCLSSCISTPQMWAHYADNHKGVCLVFRMDVNSVYDQDLQALLAPVRYAKYRVPLQAHLFNEMHFPQDHDWNCFLLSYFCFFTKGTDWQYEKEYRLRVDANLSSYVSFKNDIWLYSALTPHLQGVVLGSKCPVLPGEVDEMLKASGWWTRKLNNTEKASADKKDDKICSSYRDMSSSEHARWLERFEVKHLNSSFLDGEKRMELFVRANFAEDKRRGDIMTLQGLIPPFPKSSIRMLIESITGLYVNYRGGYSLYDDCYERSARKLLCGNKSHSKTWTLH